MEKIKNTNFGKILHTDSIEYIKTLDEDSIDLIFTSPPYDIIRKKKYGNKQGDDYQDWILNFGKEFFPKGY